jgi:hypothetical protein
MNELKLFLIDDGERHWIASINEDAARKRAIEYYQLDNDLIESITEVPTNDILTVCVEDDPKAQGLPTPPYQDELGRWYCSSLVSEWLAVTQNGDIVCSTVY